MNALFKQRVCIENVLRALIALPPNNSMDLYFKCSDRTAWHEELKQPIVKSNEADSNIAPPAFKGIASGH